jgi:hypothetical protein
MRRLNHGVFWALFLVLAGVFLLLKNLGVFGTWGDFAWGGLFTIVGLGFLIAFIANVQSWWRAIPAFTLLGLGIPMLLEQWGRMTLLQWQGPAALFGVALGFWAVLLVRRENWWAEIPAGVLTLLGLMLVFQERLTQQQTWLTVFSIGLGLVFALLYVLRARQPGGWWPAVPAAALILFGLVTWIGPVGTGQMVLRWWPVLLIPIGLVLLVLSLQRVPAASGAKSATSPDKGKPARPAYGYESIPAASGTSLSENIPDAALPPARSTGESTEAPAVGTGTNGEPDIYEFLKQQPPDTSGDGGKG